MNETTVLPADSVPGGPERHDGGAGGPARSRNPRWLRYAAAIGLPALAAAARLGFLQGLGSRNVYLTFYPAVVLAALYGGLPAGLLAAVVSSALADYFLLAPVHSFSIRDPADWLGLVLFLASCTMISWVAEAMLRAQARARKTEVQAGIEAARHREGEARALLGAIIESSEDAILSNDLKGSIQTWNAAAARIFGYRASDIIGKPVTLLIPPDHLVEEERIIQRIARGERVGHYDTVCIAEDSRRIEVSLAVSPLRNAAGEIVGASRIIHDITERRLREGSLARLNWTLKAHGASSQAMLRASDESQYLQDVCQIIVRSCGRAMVWIGFAENDEEKTVRPAAWAGFEGSYLKTLNLTWADKDRGRGPTGTAIRTGKPCACRDMRTDPAFAPWREEALRHGYASSLVLPLLADGKAFGAVTLYAQLPDAFSRDETELLTELAGDLAQGIMVLRLRAERARTEEQLSLLSGAVESAANGVVITGRDGVIKWVNPAFSRLTGYSAAEAVGQNPRVLKSGAHPPEFYRDMWQTVLGGRVWNGEVVNKRKDGTLYSEEMTITPVTGPGGAITDFIAIKQDITERKQIEAALTQSARKLARSNEELQQFAYVASHDLQEPLRAVAGYLSLVEEGLRDKLEDQTRHQIAGAIQGAERMHKLIHDLLELSRVGTRAGAFQACELNAVLDVARVSLSASIQESGATITHDPLPWLEVDPEQIALLLQNLIGNAIKFRAARPPEIHVAARPQADHWVLSVRDNGIGIEPQYFERIFQIFQRLHTRSQYPGTGIGLAICRKIVERHGGRIWVESQPGRGSVFYFTIANCQASSP